LTYLSTTATIHATVDTYVHKPFLEKLGVPTYNVNHTDERGCAMIKTTRRIFRKLKGYNTQENRGKCAEAMMEYRQRNKPEEPVTTN